jgi:hypothetical protein
VIHVVHVYTRDGGTGMGWMVVIQRWGREGAWMVCTGVVVVVGLALIVRERVTALNQNSYYRCGPWPAPCRVTRSAVLTYTPDLPQFTVEGSGIKPTR